MYFIAGLCQNHRGDIEVLQNMVRLAAQMVYVSEFKVSLQMILFIVLSLRLILSLPYTSLDPIQLN